MYLLTSINTNTKIWLAHFPDYYHKSRELEDLLSDEEKAKAEQFVFELDKLKFTISRGLLRIHLGKLLEVNPKTLRFEYNKYGKPDLSQISPNLPIKFNLSHSGDFLIYAFSNYDVGIDIEFIRPDFQPDDLVSHFFSNEEAEAYYELPCALRVPSFFWAWTRKESFVKALGQGLSFPLQQISVSILPQASVTPFYLAFKNLPSYTIVDIPMPSVQYSGSLCYKP